MEIWLLGYVTCLTFRPGSTACDYFSNSSVVDIIYYGCDSLKL